MIANVVNFFNVTLATLPNPFNYCFSDAAQTVRENINFMLNFNGVVGANWLSLSRDYDYHPSRTSFHIYPSNSTIFTISLYSDHRSWADDYFLGLLFICPKSYLLKRKYEAQMSIIGIGTQLKCMGYDNYNASYVVMSQNLNYIEFIGTRFMEPNLNSTEGYSYEYNFSLKIGTNVSRRYYEAWRICGAI
jgi:hypothetical protein